MKEGKAKRTEKKESDALALHYMTTLTDVAREAFLILDSDLHVISANTIFYKTFKVSEVQTMNIPVFELGNNQWDIPELKRLLKEILPKKKIVRNYDVEHNFETIGKKTIQLNAQQIDSSQLIVLAMEDITERKHLEQRLVRNNEELAVKVAQRTADLTEKLRTLEVLNRSMIGRELKMVELKKEIARLKSRLKKDNG